VPIHYTCQGFLLWVEDLEPLELLDERFWCDCTSILAETNIE